MRWADVGNVLDRELRGNSAFAIRAEHSDPPRELSERITIVVVVGSLRAVASKDGAHSLHSLRGRFPRNRVASQFGGVFEFEKCLKGRVVRVRGDSGGEFVLVLG